MNRNLVFKRTTRKQLVPCHDCHRWANQEKVLLIYGLSKFTARVFCFLVLVPQECFLGYPEGSALEKQEFP